MLEEAKVFARQKLQCLVKKMELDGENLTVTVINISSADQAVQSCPCWNYHRKSWQFLTFLSSSQVFSESGYSFHLMKYH